MKISMQKWSWNLCALLAALAVGGSLAIAQEAPKKAAEEPAMSAEAILDKYVEVTGGKEAYAKIKTRHSKVSMEIKGTPIKATVETIEKSPNLYFQKMTIPGMMEQSGGFDGKIAWSKDPMMGLRVLEGKELASRIHDAQFNKEVRWRDVYESAKNMGRKTVNGKSVYEVVLTPKEGSPMTSHYDAETFLLLMNEKSEESPQGKVTVKIFLSDYKEVDGIKFPHSIRMAAGPQEILMKVEEIKHNQEVSDSQFAKPEEDDE